MDVNRKIMYHFHKNVKYNEIWSEGNKIKIGRFMYKKEVSGSK